MAKLQKPEVKEIYRKLLPLEQFPPKKFNYSDDEQSMSKLKIIWCGLMGDDLMPKHFKVYDNFMETLKLVSLTLGIEFIIVFICFQSPLITNGGVSDGEYIYEPTYMDYVIDFCIEQYDNLVTFIKNY